jgi:aminodeoxychorismate synthase component I
MIPSASDSISEVAQLCWRELSLPDSNLLRVCEALRSRPWAWLLDSSSVDQRLGRFSFAGADPYLVARAFGERIEVESRRPVREILSPGSGFREEKGKFFDWLRGALPNVDIDSHGLPVDFPFLGGAVGYWGYELAEQVEALKFHGQDDLGLPDATVLFVDRLVALDHASGRFFALGIGFAATQEEAGARASFAVADLSESLAFLERVDPSVRVGDQPGQPDLGWSADCTIPRDRDMGNDGGACEDLERRKLLGAEMPTDIAGSFDAEGYRARVRKLKTDIAAGSVYEANLTRRMDFPFSGDVWCLYQALRKASPAPFAGFMELADGAILGSSPERFLRVSAAGDVESRPIKGTRPRGLSAQEDAALAADLVGSEKDRAENLMIVDLVRNDLGRVCELGSIRVPELMVLERYASVFQLVSTVEGKLGEGRDRMDLLKASFPPGSMTGAPKIAAMGLLDGLEPVRRGVYSGALGYLDLRGGMDLAVVIRTLLVQKDRVHIHVGGAVVADSDPQTEYNESLDKARAMLAALAAADSPPPSAVSDSIFS